MTFHFDDIESLVDHLYQLSFRSDHEKCIQQHFYDIQRGHLEGGTAKAVREDPEKPGKWLVIDEILGDVVVDFDKDLLHSIESELQDFINNLLNNNKTITIRRVLKRVLPKLSKAKIQVDSDPYYNDFPRYKDVIDLVTEEMQSVYKDFESADFTIDTLEDPEDLNAEKQVKEFRFRDPARVARNFVKKGRSSVYPERLVARAMQCARDYLQEKRIKNQKDLSGHVSNIIKKIQNEVLSKDSEFAKNSPSKNSIRNWVDHYLNA